MPFISDDEYAQFQQLKGGGAAPAQQEAAQTAYTDQRNSARSADLANAQAINSQQAQAESAASAAPAQMQQQYNAGATQGPGGMSSFNAGLKDAGGMLRNAFQAQQQAQGAAPNPDAAIAPAGQNEVARMESANGANAVDASAQQSLSAAPPAVAPPAAPPPAAPAAPAQHGPFGFMNRALGSIKGGLQQAAASPPPAAPAPAAPHGGMFGLNRAIGAMRGGVQQALSAPPPPAAAPAPAPHGGGLFGMVNRMHAASPAAPAAPPAAPSPIRQNALFKAIGGAASLPSTALRTAASPVANAAHAAGSAVSGAANALKKNALTRSIGRFF